MKKRLLPIALLAVVGMLATGCQNNPAPSSSSSEVPSSSSQTQYSVSITNAADLQAEWHLGEADRSIALSCAPGVVKDVLGTELLVTSSNTSVVTIINNKMAHTVGVGEADIIATYHGVESKVHVTILDKKGEPDPITVNSVKTFMAALPETQHDQLYIFDAYAVAYASGKSDFTKYGNFYIADSMDAPESERILVYGATAQEEALVYGDSGTYTFTNPQDFLTNAKTKDITLGAKVKIKVEFMLYGTTPELDGVVISYVPGQIDPEPEPEHVKGKTLAEVMAATTSNDVVYDDVQVVVKKWKGEEPDQFGNMFVVDANGENEATVYGSSATATSIKWDGIGLKYNFSNPKDFLTNELTSKIVPTWVLKCDLIRSDYNGAKQICLVIKEANAPALESIELTCDHEELNINATAKLTVTPTPATAVLGTVEYSVSPEDAGTFEGNVFTAVKAYDEVTITATAGGKTDSVTLKINEEPAPDPTSVTITGAPEILAWGDTCELSATVSPEDADQSITWSVNDETIATIDDDGVLTPVGNKEGSVVVTAASSKEGVADTATIEVKFVPIGGIESGAKYYITSQGLKHGSEEKVPDRLGALKAAAFAQKKSVDYTVDFVEGAYIMPTDAWTFTRAEEKTNTYVISDAAGNTLNVANDNNGLICSKQGDSATVWTVEATSTNSIKLSAPDAAATPNTRYLAFYDNKDFRTYKTNQTGYSYEAWTVYEIDLVKPAAVTPTVKALEIGGTMGDQYAGGSWDFKGLTAEATLTSEKKFDATSLVTFSSETPVPAEPSESFVVTVKAALKTDPTIFTTKDITVKVVADEPDVTDKYELTISSFGNVSSYGNFEATIGKVVFEGHQITKNTTNNVSQIQGNSSKGSYIGNTKKVYGKITSIVLVIDAAKLGGDDATASLFFGTSANPTENEVKIGKDTEYPLNAAGTLTINAPAGNFNFFQYKFTNYASYVKSITINVAPLAA